MNEWQLHFVFGSSLKQWVWAKIQSTVSFFCYLPLHLVHPITVRSVWFTIASFPIHKPSLFLFFSALFDSHIHFTTQLLLPPDDSGLCCGRLRQPPAERSDRICSSLGLCECSSIESECLPKRLTVILKSLLTESGFCCKAAVNVSHKQILVLSMIGAGYCIHLCASFQLCIVKRSFVLEMGHKHSTAGYWYFRLLSTCLILLLIVHSHLPMNVGTHCVVLSSMGLGFLLFPAQTSLERQRHAAALRYQRYVLTLGEQLLDGS